MDLTTATPVEIDTEIARIERLQGQVASRFEGIVDSIHRVANDKKVGTWGRRDWAMATDEALEAVRNLVADENTIGYVRTNAVNALEALAKAQADAKALREEIAPYVAQYRARRWTRAFLATSANGHIHSSRECSTCRPSTGFYWFIDLSGADEAEIVTKAGSDACTVCYPSAPVNDLKRPRSIFSDDEVAAQQARGNREVEKAARLAKKIENGLTQDGSEFVVEYVEHNAPGWERDESGKSVHVYADRTRREHFKTERAAVQWVVQYACWEKGLHAGDKAPAFAQVIEAVAAKHEKTVAEVTAEIEAKIVAKNKRDGR